MDFEVGVEEIGFLVLMGVDEKGEIGFLLVGVDEKGETGFLLVGVEEKGETGFLEVGVEEREVFTALKMEPLEVEEGVEEREGEKEGEERCLGDFDKAVFGVEWIVPLMVRFSGVELEEL